MERNVEETVRVAHVQLQPVDRCIQMNLNTLAHDAHVGLCYFNLLSLHVLAEERRELVEENLPDS
jgi:hypothetical protein